MADSSTTKFVITRAANSAAPGWYLEKREAAAEGPSIEWIKGPGSIEQVRDELRSEVDREDVVTEVIEKGLDDHLRNACQRWLESDTPENRKGLQDASHLTSRDRTTLGQEFQWTLTAAEERTTPLEPPPGVTVTKRGATLHIGATRPIDIRVELDGNSPDRSVWFNSNHSGNVTLAGEQRGGVVRSGQGPGNAIREGAGHGDATRNGDGDGDARRDGTGNGNAVRRGSGRGSAVRTGPGYGSAERNGTGTGDAIVDGRGTGNAIVGDRASGKAMRTGSGNGNALLEGEATGRAIRAGTGGGNAEVNKAARGSARIEGYAKGAATNRSQHAGDAINQSNNAGDARRSGSGDGSAVRTGGGAGMARRVGRGNGHAWRSGKGDGDAVHYSSGSGHAVRIGGGAGEAVQGDNGKAVEKDLSTTDAQTQADLKALREKYEGGERQPPAPTAAPALAAGRQSKDTAQNRDASGIAR